MPRAEELPEELRPLLKRQAFTVRDIVWNGDVDDLVRDLRSHLAEPPRRRRRPLVVAAVVLAAAAGAVAAVLLWPDPDDPGGGRPSTTAAQRTVPRPRLHRGSCRRARWSTAIRSRRSSSPRRRPLCRPSPTDQGGSSPSREPGSWPRNARTAGGCWPTSRWSTRPQRPHPAWKPGTSPTTNSAGLRCRHPRSRRRGDPPWRRGLRCRHPRSRR